MGAAPETTSNRITRIRVRLCVIDASSRYLISTQIYRDLHITSMIIHKLMFRLFTVYSEFLKFRILSSSADQDFSIPFQSAYFHRHPIRIFSTLIIYMLSWSWMIPDKGNLGKLDQDISSIIWSRFGWFSISDDNTQILIPGEAGHVYQVGNAKCGKWKLRYRIIKELM